MAELRYNAAGTLVLVPPARWATATASILDKDGDETEAPTPSLDAVSTTTASDADTTRSLIKLASASGVVRGTVYEVVDTAFGTALRKVSKVNGSWVTLSEPLPGIPAVGATFKGVAWSVPVTTTTTATLGLGFRGLLNGPETADHLAVAFGVVRHPYVSPGSIRDVARYLSDVRPSDPLLDDEEAMEDVAERADLIVRGRLLASQLYVHRFWDRSVLWEPWHTAMKLALADMGRVPGGTDVETWTRSMRFELRDLISDLLRSAGTYDDDEDDAQTDLEDKGASATMRWVR